MTLCAPGRHFKTMRFFITGLCLQGNKGGPALALSMIKVIKRELPGAEFVFSAPPEPEFQFEKIWAARYGVTVVEDVWDGGGLYSWLNPMRLLKEGLATTRRRHRKLTAWYSALRSCDVLLDMTAISYVGPPEGTEYHAMSTRWRYFQAAQRTGRLFRAWTQNYGPFSTPALVSSATKDLTQLPIVFCRGEETRRMVQELLPGKECRVFPDVAVVLDYAREQGGKHILKAFGRMPDRPLVTVSPSAVQYCKGGKDGSRESYLKSRAALVESLLDRGWAVLLVPHTLRPSLHVPELCDHSVCLEVLARTRPDPWMGIVHEDLSASDLKSIIANADVHIGSRFHSVVAALSSGVPAVSLSWHHKYSDLMKTYGLGGYVINGQSETVAQDAARMADELMAGRDKISAQLATTQKELEASVQENARLLVSGLYLK